jgi:hypothetical protein
MNSDHPIRIPKPCIFKPEKLWSGKQVVTAVIHQVSENKQTTTNLRTKNNIFLLLI